MRITRSVGCLTLWALVAYLFVKGALVLVPGRFALAMSALIAALVHACSGSPDNRAALEEGRKGDLVSVGQGNERPEGGVRLAAFDHPEVLGVNRSPLCRLFLRKLFLFTDLAETEPEPLLSPPDGFLDGGPFPNLGRPVRTIGR